MEGRDPLLVVDIKVPEVELIRRLGARLICADCGANADDPDSAPRAVFETTVISGAVGSAITESAAAVRPQTEPLRCRRCGGRLTHRADDDESVVLERLKVYMRDTQPLVEYYRQRPTFRAVNGAQAPDQVSADLAAAIEAAGSGSGVLR
jgi:adenylate kinase